MFKIDVTNFSEILKIDKLPENKDELANMTVLMKAEFPLEETGDTYFNMTEYQKGYVWANSRNLGRYWSIGPQYKIFCPGVWLNAAGQNEVYILEMMHDEAEEKLVGELTL